ncbi:uncharacterized protein LOC122016991 [Zingiber officinale]|uniref:Uncharacterized protein n=1 Tax=Zingiber officinale TaxID=94328 RepID=A0A8J5FBJ9_ZINOF|nr:uncharacterized protein LOC122016991 [Zingiber officinale]KAG6481835.1 hypothetical protein ZIOFF_058457 [Zingiber officinale]
MAEPSSASYIRMVQHLIEQCLVFHMNQEECIEALSKHANIKPVITSIVWKELEKENKEFFQAYMKEQEEKVLEMAAEERTQKMLAEAAAAAAKDSDKDDE